MAISKVKAALAAAVVSCTAVVGAPSAEAGNFASANGSSNSSGCVGQQAYLSVDDGGSHTVYALSLASYSSTALSWSRTNRIDPTRVNTVTSSSESSLTDVVVRDQDYGTYCDFTWHNDLQPGTTA